MLSRLLLLTFIIFWLELGAFLVLLPWSTLWEHNYFLFRYAELAPYLLNNAVRGVVSGLGMVDIGLAFWYAVHFGEVLARWRGQASAPAGPTPGESVSRGQTA
jgi:hypothetical protein